MSTERIKQIVRSAGQRVELLDESSLDIVSKRQWGLAISKHDLPIYTYLQVLANSGIDNNTLTNLVKLLVDLRVDVSDPYASSSELSVIVGFMSQDLLGIDLSASKKEIDKVRIRKVKIKGAEKRPARISIHTDDPLSTYEGLVKLRKWERSCVLSDNYFETISSQILDVNDEALKLLMTGQLSTIWSKLKVDPNSKSVIYFRDLKTLAGDVDLYYWGPQKESVSLELSRYLMLMGYKVDRPNILIDSIIYNKTGVDNSYLGAYLYMYFFMGKSIEFSGDSFDDHYKNDVLPAVSLEDIWPSVYKSMIYGTQLLEKCYSEKTERYPGFKDLPFRLITAALMGLSIKYDISYTLKLENFLINLGGRLNLQEIEMIRRSVYYINQIRNLYQVITQRRWEVITSPVLEEINRLITKQGGDSVEETMQMLARGLEGLYSRHLGELQNPSRVGDFMQDRSKADPIVKEAYAKVTHRYITLFRSQV